MIQYQRINRQPNISTKTKYNMSIVKRLQSGLK